MAERKFCATYEILGFYDLDDVEYVCILYCGDSYFQQIVSVQWMPNFPF